MVGNISITDMYMSALSSLSVDEKPDLIAKLTHSIRNTYTKEQNMETEDPFVSTQFRAYPFERALFSALNRVLLKISLEFNIGL